MAHLCTLMGIRHSPRTAYSPWTNGLVEVQNRNLGTHLRIFLHDTPKDWAFQVRMYAYAHKSQPLSKLSISPHEIVFHTRPRIPLTFDSNLNKTLHQLSLLLNDTDVTSDDEDHIYINMYTRIPKSDSSFLHDTTLQTKNYSTLKQLTSNTAQKSVSAINVQPNLPSLTLCPQIIPFYDISFFKYKNYFQGFFLPDDYSLDITTLQQQQSQDPVPRTVFSWIKKN